MRKFLLSCLCLAGAVSASYAEVATFDFTGDEAYGMPLLSGSTSEYNTNPLTITEGVVTMTINGQSRWWQAKSANELRFYKESGFTLQVPEDKHIEKIELTAKAPTNFSATGYENGIWEGSAASVDFKCTITKSNTPISKIVITYADGEGTGEIVTPEEPKLDVIEDLETVTALAKGTKIEIGFDATVVYYNGKYLYITDGSTTALAYYNAGGLDLKPGDVIAKGWTATTDNYNGLVQIVPAKALVAASTGAAVPAPTEVTAENAATEIVAGNCSAYVKLMGVTFEANTAATGSYTGKMGDVTVDFYNRFGNESMAAGTYDVTGFIAVYKETVQIYPVTFEGDGGVAELPVLDSLSTLSDVPDGTAFTLGMDLTVIYTNGAYTYVTDGITNSLIYKYDLGVNAGDVIAKGWDASLKLYNGLMEIVPTKDVTVASTGAAVPEPTLVDETPSHAVMASNQAAYLKLANVAFDEGTKASGAFTGTMDNETINFYNVFKLEACEAGTYDVVGFVSVNKDNAQFYPISFTKVSTSAITDIDASVAPAKYFNLQGIEVANPEAGKVYIRVQGNKADKVIL